MRRILLVLSVAAMMVAPSVALAQSTTSGTLLGPIDDPNGGITCQGDIFGPGAPGTPHGTVTVQRTAFDELKITIVLEGGDPNTTHTIELFEATDNCGDDNDPLAATGVTLTTDAQGNGTATFVVQLPRPTLGGEVIGDGTGSEELVIVLDRKLSLAPGDRFVATVPIPQDVALPVPATVTITPADAVNPVGTSHTVTATVKDATGQPVEGAEVRFRVEGSVSTTGSCTTDTQGRCTFTFQGPNLPGATVITAFADTQDNNEQDPDEPFGEATKAFILPDSTPGQVTGGGQILNASGNDKIAFGFNAKSTTSALNSSAVKGNCTLVDPSTDTKIKCLDVASLVQTATHATFFGRAEVTVGQGDAATTEEVTYRIDVDDLGEPGKDRDTFKIQTDSGYTASGVLKAGNIQIHGN